jgi:prophage regulatory protein
MSEKSEKFIRLAEVQRRVPYSRSTIYLKISRGEFPPPIDLGARAVAWLDSEIDEWVASRIAKGRPLAPVAPAPENCKGRAGAGSKNRAGVSA